MCLCVRLCVCVWFIHKHYGVLSRSIIDEAENRAARNDGCWKSRYTLQGSSDEMHVADLPGASRILAARLPEIAEVAARSLLPPPLGARDMRVYNALIVRYDALMRRDHMPAHADFSLITVNIALNSGFEGGGTWFQALGGDGGEVVSAVDTGHAVLHAGGLVEILKRELYRNFVL